MLEDLYRRVIMEHSQNPQNFGLVDDDTYLGHHLFNRSCGDDIKVQLKIEYGNIVDIRQQGKGCSICCASASVMTMTLKNKNIYEAKEAIEEFLKLSKGEPFKEELLYPDSKAFQGVSRFPARVRCATISWRASLEVILLYEKRED